MALNDDRLYLSSKGKRGYGLGLNPLTVGMTWSCNLSKNAA